MKKNSLNLRLIICGALCFWGIFAFAAEITKTPHWSLTWKQFIMNGPKLEQIGNLPEKTSFETEPSLWSIGCETLDREYGKFDNYRPYLKELGLRSARIQSGWAKTEQRKGKYDFSWLDPIVDGLTKENIRPWMCLSYGNPIYGAEKTLGSKIFSDTQTMEAWRRYVKAVVSRYKNKINEWEVWNEPNLGVNASAYKEYASLLCNTIEVIKSIQPDAKIIAFGASGVPVNYIKKVLDLVKEKGYINDISYVSFHPYYPNPDDATTEIIALKNLVRSYSPNIALFQGESGCPSCLEWAHALRYMEWTEYSQAKWIARRMANDWMLGNRCNIFTFVDLQYANMIQSFGLMRCNLLKEPVYRRPSFFTVRNMVNLFSPELKSIGKLSFEANTQRKLTVGGISKCGKIVGAIIWMNDRIPTSELVFENTDIWIKGLSIKNPVMVEMVTGRIYALPVLKGSITGGLMKFSALPLWDSPIVILDKRALPADCKVEEIASGGSVADMKF